MGTQRLSSISSSCPGGPALPTLQFAAAACIRAMLCVFLRWFTFVKTWVISLTNSCFWYIHLGGDYHFEGENVISEILMTDADALVLPSKIQGPFCKNDSEYNCTCRWWFPRRLLISRSPTHLIHTRTAHQVAQLLLISVPSISASRAAFTQPQSSPWIPFKLTLPAFFLCRLGIIEAVWLSLLHALGVLSFFDAGMRLLSRGIYRHITRGRELHRSFLLQAAVEFPNHANYTIALILLSEIIKYLQIKSCCLDFVASAVGFK